VVTSETGRRDRRDANASNEGSIQEAAKLSVVSRTPLRMLMNTQIVASAQAMAIIATQPATAMVDDLLAVSLMRPPICRTQ
jgi:formylmethanofuran dehydrogenase subunit B